jgi:hypothetical protein
VIAVTAISRQWRFDGSKEAAMPTIRRYIPEIDKPHCEECSDAAEIVIDHYPTRQQCRTLCRDCATAALQAHPNLLASLVIALILKGERPVLAPVVRWSA